MNVAYLLTEVLELRQRPGADPEAPPASAPARGFLPLLAESERAFEEAFVLGEPPLWAAGCACVTHSAGAAGAHQLPAGFGAAPVSLPPASTAGCCSPQPAACWTLSGWSARRRTWSSLGCSSERLFWVGRCLVCCQRVC